MQLAKSPQIIEKLSEFDDYFRTSGTDCWEAPSGNIKLYLFSTIYDTVQELQDQYKILRDHVAISFQSRTLDKPAERWNLYILYFVKEQVPQDIKQIILQDKFSARKLICSVGHNILSEKFMSEQVTKTLMDIDIPEKVSAEAKLEMLIVNEHPRVALAIEKMGLMNDRENITTLIDILNNEQN